MPSSSQLYNIFSFFFPKGMAYYKPKSCRLSTESIQFLSHFYTILISQKLRAFPNIVLYVYQTFLSLDPYLLFMQRNPYTLPLRRCHTIVIFFFPHWHATRDFNHWNVDAILLLCSVSKFLRAKKTFNFLNILIFYLVTHLSEIPEFETIRPLAFTITNLAVAFQIDFLYLFYIYTI